MAAKPADKPADKPAAADAKAAEAAKASATRQRDLDSAISSITKAYGDGSIMRLGAAHALKKIEVIPTGQRRGSAHHLRNSGSLQCSRRHCSGLSRRPRPQGGTRRRDGHGDHGHA